MGLRLGSRVGWGLVVTLLAGLDALPASAQEDRVPSGVRIGFIYQTGYRPKLAIRPFEQSAGAREAAERAYDIVQRDLDYSDRFEMARTPVSLASGPIDYRPWNDLGVVFLVSGDVQTEGGGFMLRLTLHDVVYGSVKEISAFRLPELSAANFRMAVHAAADELVGWATGQPGSAASRIAFRRKTADGMELLVVDSDGENLQRVTRSAAMLFSPSWAPDGQRLLYHEYDGTTSRIIERGLAGGRSRTIDELRGMHLTPTYSPDGRRVAFARWDAGGSRIYEYDAGRECCMRRLTGGPRDDMSPTYSADGRQFAFNSNRLGQSHIYVVRADGDDPTLLSPFVYGERGEYNAPDWAPTGSLVAFHGRSRGEFQIMVADAARPGATVQQITATGASEDPSWAPDARHVVFSGYRSGGWGLFIIDSVTGRERPLVTGAKYELPDWSPVLMTSEALAIR
ncbi:MAG: hypothetical protein ACRELD_08680 [Longimicrobiales bacterium]